MIEFACDICGQKQLYPEDRMGRDVDCRVCGAPYELNKHTIARDEEEETQEDDEVSAWVLVRSTVVGAIILFIVGGLSVLPFYEPDPSSRAQAGGIVASRLPATPNNGLPPGFPQHQFPPGFPQHNLHPPFVPPTGIPNGVPGVDTKPNGPPNMATWPPARPNGAVPPANGANQNPGGAKPMPVEVARADAGKGGGNGLPMPADVGAKNEPEMAADGAPEADPKGEDVPLDFTDYPNVRSVAVGNAAGGTNIVVKGSKLSKVRRVLPFYIPYWNVRDVEFRVVSDTQIETNHVALAGVKSVGVVLVSDEGLTITVPERTLRIKQEQTIDIQTGRNNLVVVEAGGKATTQNSAMVVVERGGELTTAHPFGLFVVARGGKIRSNIPPRPLFLAEGAEMDQKSRLPSRVESVAGVRICKVKSLATVK